ncbi:HNH endonuclease [bacterium]|nr:HNH endonuclease [bacterium]
MPRNHKYRELAFKNANYTCELCGNKETFKDKNGNEYFEGHHLIMYNITSQKRYKKCLDIPKNIVCLCPNCHKKIHQAEDNEMKKGLMILFEKHNELFGIYEIENMDDILSDYKQERKGRN